MEVCKWNCTEVQIYWDGVRSTVSTLILRFSINSGNFTHWAAITGKVLAQFIWQVYSKKNPETSLLLKKLFEVLWKYQHIFIYLPPCFGSKLSHLKNCNDWKIFRQFWALIILFQKCQMAAFGTKKFSYCIGRIFMRWSVRAIFVEYLLHTYMNTYMDGFWNSQSL